MQSSEGRKLGKLENPGCCNWGDTNAQYYGSYFGRRNLKDQDHSDFRPAPTWESAIGIPPWPGE